MGTSAWNMASPRWGVAGQYEAARANGAAIRCPLGLEQAEIAYDLSLPIAARHTLRIQGSQRDRVFLVQVNGRQLAILRQPLESEPRGNVLLAEERLRLTPGSWVRVRVQISENSIAAQVITQRCVLNMKPLQVQSQLLP